MSQVWGVCPTPSLTVPGLGHLTIEAPNLAGRQVAHAARVLRPKLKVLLITGYAENAVLNHGHLQPGKQVVTTLFVVEDLARRIRGILSDG